MLRFFPTDDALAFFHRQVNAEFHLPEPDQLAIYWPLKRKGTVAELQKSVEPVAWRSDELELGRGALQRIAEFSSFNDPAQSFTLSSVRVRQLKAKAAMAEGYEEEVSFYAESLDLAEKEIEDLTEQLNDEKSKVFYYQQKLRSMDDNDKETVPLQSLRANDTLQALQVIRDHPWHGTRYRLHPNAQESAVSAKYRDPQVLLDAIDLIAQGFYSVEVTQESQASLVALANEVGFEYSPHESEQTRQRDKYMKEREVTWDGVRIRTERHLKKGTSRDSRACLRVYFQRCRRDGSDFFLITHLGGHLTTART